MRMTTAIVFQCKFRFALYELPVPNNDGMILMLYLVALTSLIIMDGNGTLFCAQSQAVRVLFDSIEREREGVYVYEQAECAFLF